MPPSPSEQQKHEALERLLKAPPPELRAISHYEPRLSNIVPTGSIELANLYFSFVDQEFRKLEDEWRERGKSSGRCGGY